ncbi:MULTISPECIES: FAD-dependent oxidoreductase [unclassified Spirosoma]|uniref:NAD(P)/FAD-dependent oxidoreductase n=1 Tax=unclassified Spirosoma TaxID=2621999 RepID=UPI0009652114|nr:MULTISPECIES: FAD-dependent oxidoreductase [unclassified Spirosoma]MBN8825415.1 FAD-dependent oxidoreductase [Spirosoma sp.]OJW74926.1 MAG: FAD-dependent oxidoreductase [Spirosoma sp. 48-14]
MKHLIIIGNGIAGITTARHVRQQDSTVRITVISAESDHFYSRTALMYIYMGHMTYAHTKPYEDGFWAKNRIDLLRGYVEQVDTSAKRIRLADGQWLDYDALVLATGSVSTTVDWPGLSASGVQGLYGLPDLERMEQFTKNIERAVVVGGGLIGVELAEMLRSRHIDVTMLVRDPHYWSSTLPAEEGKLVGRHLLRHGVDLRLETELKEILAGSRQTGPRQAGPRSADPTGRVRAVVTKTGEEIPCQFVGLGIGVTPNVAFLKNSGVELGKGVLVNEYFETNVADVYAIGDCNEFRQPILGTDGALRKPIEQIWYTGRMHGETLARTLCGSRTAYRPGAFFNSAKFFDIEYQTYGTLNAQLTDDEQTYYWEHPSGEQCLRINYRKTDQSVVGIHALGIRLRQAVCDRWIQDRTPFATVVSQLRQADFNPEFSESFTDQLTGHAPAGSPDRRKGWFHRLFSATH